MSNEENIKKFFDGLSHALDEVYDVALGTLDTVTIKVDEFVDEWRKNALEMVAEAEGKGEEVKVEPDWDTKIRDIYNYRKSNGNGGTMWEEHIKGLYKIDEGTPYAEAVWNALPDEAKSYVKRDPASPL